MNLEGLGLTEHDKRRIRGDVDYFMTPTLLSYAKPVLGRHGTTVCYIETGMRTAYVCQEHPALGLMAWHEYEAHLEKVQPTALKRPCPLCHRRAGFWPIDKNMKSYMTPGLMTVVVLDGSNTRRVFWGGQITEAIPPSECGACGVDVRTWPK